MALNRRKAMGEWHVRVPWESQGQASVEYALVLVAFLSMVAAFACIWHAGKEGRLLRQATEAASHQLEWGDVRGSVRDLALY